eukprot:scaffold34597_cov96-Skeletonema_dohrnii-CCMP3373.AAC.3
MGGLLIGGGKKWAGPTPHANKRGNADYITVGQPKMVPKMVPKRVIFSAIVWRVLISDGLSGSVGTSELYYCERRCFGEAWLGRARGDNWWQWRANERQIQKCHAYASCCADNRFNRTRGVLNNANGSHLATGSLGTGTSNSNPQAPQLQMLTAQRKT